MAYLGNSPVLSQQEYRNIDNISGSFNGVTTSFPLLVNGVAPVPAPQSSNQCLISVNGVVQKPDDTGTSGFRLSGGNIVFSAAPTGGQSFFGVILAGADYVYSGSNFPDGTVSAPSITFAQDLDTGFYRSGAGEVKFTANGANVVTLSANNFTAPSFIPTSSTVPTNGVYLPSANNVAISTNGSGRLFVDSSGRLGLGTANPGTTLHLSASSPRFRLEDSDGGYAHIEADGGNLFLVSDNAASQANSFLAFGVDGSEKARIDSSGRLGLGSSSPQAILDVAPDANRNLLVQGKAATTYGLELKNGSANSAGEFHVTAASSGSVVINRGSTEIARFNSTGLGIGTTSPTELLSIGFADSSSGKLEFRTSSYAKVAMIEGSHDSGAANGSLRFWTRNAGTEFERARIDSSGRLLVGTSSDITGQAKTSLQLVHTDHPILALGRNDSSVVEGDPLGWVSFYGNDDDGNYDECARVSGYADGTHTASSKPTRLVFSTTDDGASSPTERMRIQANGNILFGTTTQNPGINNTTVGCSVNPGYASFSRNDTSVYISRTDSDGELVSFVQGGTQEGSISVSGTTVSYNGAHLSRWSQLPGGAERTEILRGTVLSNIDEMCEWGEEDNEQLNRMKVSDVEGDPNVAGVFQGWDDDDDTYTDDFYCAMTGDFIIRIAEGVTVQRGDLLMSAGDGTAKPQEDDIIRSKTVAEVTSTHVTCTYDDGSYCVPCVLMAC